MTRDFQEERRVQMIREESERLFSRADPWIKELYMQSPLLRFLHTAPPKDVVEYRKRMLAEQRAAGNIIEPESEK